MRKFFTQGLALLVLLCLLGTAALANNYYISAVTGDDTRTAAQAQNPATPWKTVAPVKANYGIFLPGDSVLFMRGERHVVSDLRPTVSGTAAAPMVFGAYGTGAAPILTGATTVTGFTAIATPGVFSKTLSSANAVRFVFKNAERQPLSRYPNAGYLYVTGLPSSGQNRSFFDANLPQTTTDYWKGANVGIRFEDWEWFNDSVTAYNGSTKQITLKGTAYGNLRNGWGYYFTNKLEIVDSAGEWYQNGNMLYYCQPVGTDPATISLEVTSIRNAFLLRNVSYIHIVNLDFEKYAADALYVDITGTGQPYNQGLAFKNLRTSFTWTRGLELRNCAGTLIQNCVFADSQYEGVGIEACTGTEMVNCQVLRTAPVPGLQYRAGNGIAVRPIGSTVGYGNRITGCLVDSSGKHGIRLEDSLTTVEKTVIKRSSLTTSDIGAIYLIGQYCGKDTIRHCFTSETVSFTGGYPLNSVTTATGKGRGLYVDDFAHDVWMESNTSFNNSSFGIHLINGRNCTVKNNLTYGNGFAEINFQEANSRTPRIPAGWCKHDVQDNVFFATSPQNVVVRQETQDYNDADFGVINNNLYHHPTDKEVHSIFRPMHLDEPLTSPPTGQTFKTLGLLTLPEYRTFSGGQDAGSRITKFKFKPFTVTGTLSANLITNPDFETGVSGWSNESSTDFTMSQVMALNNKALSYKYTGSADVNRKNFTHSQVLNPDLAIGDYCRLIFTSKATNPYTTLRPFFAQNVSPFGFGGFGKDVNAQTTAKTDTLVFQITPDFKTSSVLKFASSIDAGEYFLDDVSLQKVSVTTNNLNKQLLFVNPTATQQTFALNGAANKYFTLDSAEISGSVTVPAWSSTVVFAVGTNVVLPVSLAAYNVTKAGNAVAVEWTTATEQANDRFEIEHGTDGRVFTEVGVVRSAGNGNGMRPYRFLHTAPVTGLNYYRLTQVDKDGGRKSFGVKTVRFDASGEVRLFPQPAEAEIKALHPAGMFSRAELVDATGRVLQQTPVQSTGVQTVFDLGSLAGGFYLIRLHGPGGEAAKTFIKK